MLPQPNLEALAADAAASLLGQEAIPRLTIVSQDLSSSRLGLAHALFCNGQFEQAWHELSQILCDNPELALAHHVRGIMLAGSNRLDQAVKALELAIKLDASSHASYLMLAQTLEKLERPEHALSVVDRLLVSNPSMAEAHSLRGEILKRQGRTLSAIDALRVACQHNPLEPRVRLTLAQALSESQRFEEALSELLICRQIAPSNPEILLAHADALRDCGHHEEAAQIYRLALIQSPLQAALYARLGQCFWRQNKLTAAIGLLRTSLILDPRRIEAYECLAEIYRTMGYLAESDQMSAAGRRIAGETGGCKAQTA
jgi:predicted Zn-dependent protease